MRVFKYLLAFGLAAATPAAFAALADDVGDADTFGRSVKYLGGKGAPMLNLTQDCANVATFDRCILITPNSFVNIDQSNLLSIKLPSFSTLSMVCFSVTTNISYRFNNTSTARMQHSFSMWPTFTIESTVLNNPSIIDPTTGLPANGKLVSRLNSFSVINSLQPGDTEQQSLSFSRECVGGLVSRSYLLGIGLTSSQVTSFFANPITITFGAAGTANNVLFASYLMGVRLYGD